MSSPGISARRRGRCSLPAEIRAKAAQFGIDPAEIDRFKNPVLVRELADRVEAQKAITDFNKSAAAELTPEERAVSDGRRLSPETVTKIAAKLEDVGEEARWRRL